VEVTVQRVKDCLLGAVTALLIISWFTGFWDALWTYLTP